MRALSLSLARSCTCCTMLGLEEWICGAANVVWLQDRIEIIEADIWTQDGVQALNRRDQQRCRDAKQRHC